MADNDKAGDILADSVGSTACPKCNHVVDLSNVAAFSNVQCPQCKTPFTAPGRLGQFILLRLLGKGEMGATYKARDKVLGRSVAIKVMKRSLGQDHARVEHFLAEGRALASLDHPNAVRIFSLGQEKDQPYIVMELITGKSLDKKYSLDKAMDEALALNITIQIAQALQAASKINLIHGDVKPANIMIGEEGGAKLVDFGIAKFGGGQAAGGATFGTPYYVAPEQVQRGSIDHRTDVYSLGATLFHILGCMPPFPGKSMKEVLQSRLEKPAPDLLKIRPSLHRETAAIVARMLQRAPDDRYNDYEELLKDLRHAHGLVTGKAAPAAVPATAVPATAVPAMAARPVGVLPALARTKLGMGVAIGAAVLTMAVGVFLYMRFREDPQPGVWQGPTVKQVASPVFSPPGRTITEPLDVSVACDTDGAKIHYTTDGSDPTKSSPVVSGKIPVKPGVTLKAKAYLDDWEPSPVVKAVYTRHKMTIVEILPVQTSTRAAWESAKVAARSGGMQEKLKQGETLFRTAEELYKQSAYDEAKPFYEKLAAVCKEMEKLAADRKPALDARKGADDAIKALHALNTGKDPKDPWNKLKTEAQVAFNKGDFAGAVRLWKESAQKAQARKAEMDASIAAEWEEAQKKYDVQRVKDYAKQQWKGVEDMLKKARDHKERKDLPKARHFYREAIKRLREADKVAAKAFAEAEKTKEITKQIDALQGEHKYREALAKVNEGLKRYPKDKPLLTRKKTIEDKLYLDLEVKRGGPRVLMRLALIPLGKFMMGSPKNEAGRGSDEKQHEVTLTKPFYMALREVTFKQFRVFADEMKYKTSAERLGSAMSLRGSQWYPTKGIFWRKPGFEQTPEHAVACVSWNDARAFCAWLTGKTKKNVRLPTEAEWEHACRARTTTRFAFGQKDEQFSKHGNYADSSSGLLKRDQKLSDGHARTAPVGRFKPNAWGLFDMHGNVAEWCRDMYGPYPKTPVTDPVGLPLGKYPVIRGGSWFDLPGWCRSGTRARAGANRRRDFSSTNVGFRVVVEATPIVVGLSRSADLALDAKATSPDGHDNQEGSGGDQAAIDGKADTYWDEAGNKKVCRVAVTFPARRKITALRITRYKDQISAPKDFEILCDRKIVKTVRNAQYRNNSLNVAFPETPCKVLELKITRYYGTSPAIRQLEVFGIKATNRKRAGK